MKDSISMCFSIYVLKLPFFFLNLSLCLSLPSYTLMTTYWERTL